MNKSHKRTKFNRINPLSVGIALVIGLIWCCTPGQYDDVYVAEPEVTPVVKVEAKELTKAEIESKIKLHFPKSYHTMIAVAYAESGLNHNSQNWNCWYNKDETIVYSSKVQGSHSTSCKKSHRVYSWSIDCGTLMKNYIGITQCPNVSVDEHLKEMAELSKSRGFNPWFGYTNGSYKKYLAQN